MGTIFTGSLTAWASFESGVANARLAVESLRRTRRRARRATRAGRRALRRRL